MKGKGMGIRITKALMNIMFVPPRGSNRM